MTWKEFTKSARLSHMRKYTTQRIRVKAYTKQLAMTSFLQALWGIQRFNNYIFLRIGLNFFVCFECDKFDDLGFEV